MFVDKKFIFISLPRCASTSFMITCLRNDISIEHYTQNINKQLSHITDWKRLTNEELADRLTHLHEPLIDLQKKFGNKYDVISIRRNKYDRFLSLWKHIIDELYRIKCVELADVFSKLSINDIFDGIHSNDIINAENRDRWINTYLKKFDNFNKNNSEINYYIKNMISILFTPIIELTNENPNIIWFDINELYKLENWVSKKLGKEFKLEKINSSQHFECNIKINDEFKEKYDYLYGIFENRKLNKTLI
jgi:hypothetical protein